MNIKISIFTVLEKDLKNVSERKLPICNLEIQKVYKLIAFLSYREAREMPPALVGLVVLLCESVHYLVHNPTTP